MIDPMVCAVMLTRDRPAMARRAIAAFRAQSYERKRLMVLRSAPEFECITDPMRGEFTAGYAGQQVTIGVLRNGANESAKLKFSPDIIVHFDDDDLSHPRRIEEQVALLIASGKQCVGFNELLFWDTRELHERPNQAWLYRNPDPRWLAGASMMYTRAAWEACPFDDAPHEDQRWVMKNAAACMGVSAIAECTDNGKPFGVWKTQADDMNMPRLICQMHAGGTEQIPRSVMECGGGGVWRRAPEWDAHCAERMGL